MDDNVLYKNNFISKNLDTNNINQEDYGDSDEDNDDVKNVIQETHLLIVDSKDRDWDGESSDPFTFDYTVKFAPSSDLGEARGQARLAHFLKTFKNIISIEFTDIILPDIYLDLKTLHALRDTNHNIITSSNNVNIDSRNIRFPRLSDLPYISLKINEIGSNIDGTNSEINTSTVILVPANIRELSNNNSGNYSDNDVITYQYNNLGKNIIANSKNNSLIFKSITPWKRLYYPNPKNSINLINVSFFEPSGTPIKLLNDFIEVESVGLGTMEECGEVLELINNKYTTNLDRWTANHPAKRIDPSATLVSTSSIQTTGSGTFSTDSNGNPQTFYLSTNIDGTKVTLTSTNGLGGTFSGQSFVADDYLIISDLDSGTNNSCNFVVKSVNSEGTIIDLISNSHDINKDSSMGLNFQADRNFSQASSANIQSLTGSGINGSLSYETNKDGNIVTVNNLSQNNGSGYTVGDIIYIEDTGSTTNKAYFKVLSVNNGIITELENKTYLINGKFEGSLSNITIGTKTTNSNPSRYEYYTNSNGSDSVFKLSTNTDGTEVSLSIENSGKDFNIGDVIIVKDINTSDNLARFIISSVNSVGSIESFKSSTYFVTNRFQESQTLVDVTDITTNGNGQSGKFKITTNDDGSRITIHIISGGLSFSIGDTIVLVDPGVTNNKAYFTVESVGTDGKITSFTEKFFNINRFLFQPNQSNVTLITNNIENISSNSNILLSSSGNTAESIDLLSFPGAQNQPVTTGKLQVLLGSEDDLNTTSIYNTHGNGSTSNPDRDTFVFLTSDIKSLNVNDVVNIKVVGSESIASTIQTTVTQIKVGSYGNVHINNTAIRFSNSLIGTVEGGDGIISNFTIESIIKPLTKPNLIMSSNSDGNIITLSLTSGGENYNPGDIIKIKDPYQGTGNKAYFRVKSLQAGAIQSFYDNTDSSIYMNGSTNSLKPIYNIDSGNLQGNQTNVTINTITHNREGITAITGKLTTNSNQISNEATLTLDTKGKNYRKGDIIEVLDPGTLGTFSNKAFFEVKSVTGNLLTINTNTYFSPEEYKVGDKIIIRDMKFSKNAFYDVNNLDSKELEVFLTRKDGHIIINLSESNNNTTISRSNMFNQIQISFPYTLETSTGNSTITSDFNVLENIEGKIGSTNTTTSVTISNTNSSNYSTIISSVSDYYNNKKIIFIDGAAKDSIRTIIDYGKDSNNNLIATLNNPIVLPSEGDKFRLITSSESEGKLINLYLQNIISFKLVTEKRDEAIFKDNIII